MRRREIDFLRGVAVILVIFNHAHVNTIFYQSGWIGVDLFFVLSGFLVSGLIFKEYKQHHDVKVGLFLIRRGFKIYPLFYFTIVSAIILEFVSKHKWPPYYQIVSELFFLQSYIKGILGITWSLAVEEHFYFALAIATFIYVRLKLLNNFKVMFYSCLVVLILSFGLRVQNHLNFPFKDITHHFPTHLRIDSLLFGVMISYAYYFKIEMLNFVARYRSLVLILAGLLLSVAFVFIRTSFFVYTFGFTMLYIGFGLILIVFVMDENINKKLDKVLTKPLIDLISKIGFYSYGIYLWHMMIIRYLLPAVHGITGLNDGSWLEFLFYLAASLMTGILFSYIIEQRFLKMREVYFPKSKSWKLS